MGGGVEETPPMTGNPESLGSWSTVENENHALGSPEGNGDMLHFEEEAVSEQLEEENDSEQLEGDGDSEQVQKEPVVSEGMLKHTMLGEGYSGDEASSDEALSEEGGRFEPDIYPPTEVAPVRFEKETKLPSWLLPAVVACLVVMTGVAVSFALQPRSAPVSTLVMVPPFDKAAYTAANYATVLAEVYEGDSLPPAPTLAKQRTLLEEASINIRTLTFENRDDLADKLEASAVVAQQASDDLVEMYVSALTGVQLVESYMVILNRRLSNNQTAGNETWLAAEFETFVKGADDCLVDSLEKADRAYTSLAEFQGQMSLASRIGKQVSAPLKRDLLIIQKEQESTWWRWKKTSDLFLADESSALEGVLSDLSAFQHQLGQIRVVLKGHREHLHTIRNAFFYSARDSVPMESQQATLEWALETVKESQTTIQENKRRKLSGS